jgi:hypothetical protein
MSSRDQLDHPAECTDLFRDTTISFTQSIFLMCLSMVGAVRLELTTYRLKADYSNQLSYAPICLPLLSLSITGSPLLKRLIDNVQQTYN